MTTRNSGPRGFAAAALLALAFALVPAAAASADTLTVSSTHDPASGFRCPAAGSEPCTLRAALGQNDDDGGGDTVVVPPGRYVIGAPLEVQHDVTVQAADPADAPVIDANGGAGILAIAPGQQQGAPDIHAVVLRNLVLSGVGGSGGRAIEASEALGLTLDHVTVRDNEAGGISAALTTVIENSAFLRNTGEVGGAVDDNAPKLGSLEIRSSVFAGNRASDGGAVAVTNPDQTLTVTASQFSDNSAATGGGLVISSAPSVTLVEDSTFSRNAAVEGASIFVSAKPSTSLRLSYDTIIDEAAVSGSAIDGDLSAIEVDNSVLADDRDGACGGPGILSGGHNVTDDHSCALAGPGDRENLDPRLGALRDNGRAAVATAVPEPDSPLLDSAAGPCPATDASGVSRPQGAGCDIGAAERAAVAPTATTGVATGADVSGVVDPGGQPTDIRIEYGPTSAYGASLPLNAVNGWLPVALSATLPAPIAGGTVHYRVVAHNPAGVSAGADATLTTPPARALAIAHLRVKIGPPGRSAVVLWSASAPSRLRFAIVDRRGHPHGTFLRQSQAGANRATFPLTLLRRLPPGAYRLTATSATGGPQLARTRFRLHG